MAQLEELRTNIFTEGGGVLKIPAREPKELNDPFSHHSGRRFRLEDFNQVSSNGFKHVSSAG